MERDPVCGAEVETEVAIGPVYFEGRAYYFCSVTCQEQFEQDPARFVEPVPE